MNDDKTKSVIYDGMEFTPEMIDELTDGKGDDDDELHEQPVG